VRLDGADIWNWDPDELGLHIGYLPQDVELFPATIAQNIARMRTGDDDAVLRAARMADVHEMILRLPEGYNTDLGEYGHRLSGGQKQRIGLARALYGDPALVVMDEPAANLDSPGEQALHSALAKLKESGRTVIVVAHQPSTLCTADKVLVLKEGRVSALGQRDEVLRALMARPVQQGIQEENGDRKQKQRRQLTQKVTVLKPEGQLP
jgi:ABC-type protease/lipase transport system fused ATPase/permease subunit